MATQKWTIDTQHSEVQFKVKHLAIANVSGTFKTFSGQVRNENDDFSNAEIHFELDTNSIDTNSTERDNHLKSDLFLNAEKFPKITFEGKLIKSNEAYQLNGNLTILETTKPVSLNADFTGTGTGRHNDTRAGFEIDGKINRKDYGLTFHLLNDAGNLVVGEEVKLHFDIEIILQP